MDDELLAWLYHRLLGDPSRSHTADCTYSDALIVFIFLFGTISNHSSRWACCKRNCHCGAGAWIFRPTRSCAGGSKAARYSGCSSRSTRNIKPLCPAAAS